MPEGPLHTYAARVAYDGRRYHGWQRLSDRPTVQGALEDALTEALGEPVKVAGAGRTDQGAHAEGQVASFRLSTERSPSLEAIRAHLPEDIRIRDLVKAPDGFHPRRDATSKLYEYCIDASGDPEAVWIVDEPLDVEAMHVAMQVLVGEHDFATFATRARYGQRDTVRTMHAASAHRDGERVTLRFEADGFLNHMVRNLALALVRVGIGEADLRLLLEARRREVSEGTAPASGLYLVAVRYASFAFPE